MRKFRVFVSPFYLLTSWDWVKRRYDSIQTPWSESNRQHCHIVSSLQFQRGSVLIHYCEVIWEKRSDSTIVQVSCRDFYIPYDAIVIMLKIEERNSSKQHGFCFKPVCEKVLVVVSPMTEYFKILHYNNKEECKKNVIDCT